MNERLDRENHENKRRNREQQHQRALANQRLLDGERRRPHCLCMLF